MGSLMPFEASQAIESGDWVSAKYAFRWISNRIHSEQRGDGKPLRTHEDWGGRKAVWESWSDVERQWSDALLAKTLENDTELINKLNFWIDKYLPSGRDASGQERQRLLANLRAERTRKAKNKAMMTVNFTDFNEEVFFRHINPYMLRELGMSDDGGSKMGGAHTKSLKGRLARAFVRASVAYALENKWLFDTIVGHALEDLRQRARKAGHDM